MLQVTSLALLQRVMDVVEVVPEKGVIGKQFKKEAKPLMEWLGALDHEGVERLEGELEKTGYE